MAVVAAPGFQPLQISDIKTLDGNPLPADFHNAITDAIVTRDIKGASTFILQLTDPHRAILNSPNFLAQGSVITIPDGFGNTLQFVLRQFAKASDQVQLIFESRIVYSLRQIRGVVNSSNIVDAGQFVHDICAFFNIPFIGPIADPYIQPTAYAVGSGSTFNPQEDAWTSFQRIAGTLGWRCWESAGAIFFGPDEYWFNKFPPANVWYNHNVPHLKEFTDDIQLMDFNWDVGAPFGDLSITCISAFWQYNPGEIIYAENLGPGSGFWMVSSMQRDFFNPQASVVCTVPLPAAFVLNPPVTPITGGRVIQ